MADRAEGVETLRERLAAVVAARGHLRLPEAVQLSSGAWSRDFVDAKRALSRGGDLALACRALSALAARLGARFHAVGGLTMGADQFAHGIALLEGTRWFVIRKAPKGRGTDRRIEGAELTGADRVLLVEDVVTTAGSLMEAHDVVRAETDAEVVAALALVDRAGVATERFAGVGVPFAAVLDYSDLGIEPVAVG